MLVTIVEQQCNNCGHIWTFRTDDSIGTHNSQSCPQCDETNTTTISVDYEDR